MNKIAAYYEILSEHPLWKTAMYRSDNPYAKSTELTDEERAKSKRQGLSLLGGTALGGLAGAALPTGNRLLGGLAGAGIGAGSSLLHSSLTGGLSSNRLLKAQDNARQWEKNNPLPPKPSYDKHTAEDRSFLRDYAEQLQFDDDHHPSFDTQEELEDYMDRESVKNIDKAYAALKKKTGKDIGRRKAKRLYYDYRSRY